MVLFIDSKCNLPINSPSIFDNNFCLEHLNRQWTFYELPVDADDNDYRNYFCCVNLKLMSSIHKFQCGYELFTTLRIVGDSDLAGIYTDQSIRS